MAFSQSEIQILTEYLSDYRPTQGRAATLGTQTLHISYPELIKLMLKQGITFAPLSRETRYEFFDLYEKQSSKTVNANVFLFLMGFDSVINIDILAHTPKAYEYDLGNPVPEELWNRFDLILDGCTGHHVFDRLQLFKNINNMLAVGGRVVHTTMLDPLGHVQGLLNLHAMMRFYESNGYGDIKAFVCDNLSRNTVYEIKGDLHNSRNSFDLSRFNLMFMATKQKKLPLKTSFLSWAYEQYQAKLDENSVSVQSIRGRKLAVWGTRGHYELYYRDLVLSPRDNHRIMGIVDSDPERWGTLLDGYEVGPPESLQTMDVDAVLLASNKKNELMDGVIDLLYAKPEVVKNTYNLYRHTFLFQDNFDAHSDYWSILGR
ncbi:MAG: hypothetical protein HUN04_08490 [Desulfobacter sp.]|nr:MAG: hypothetical protein HUN04_08490 [Desulfobacter sp.]